MTAKELIACGYGFSSRIDKGFTIFIYSPTKFVGGVTRLTHDAAMLAAVEMALLDFVESRLDIPNL